MTWKPVRNLEFRIVQIRMFADIFRQGLRLYRHPLRALQALQKLRQHGKEVLAGQKLHKGFKISGKYGWDMFHPLWPSPAFNKFFYHHLEEVLPSGQNKGVLRRLLVAITKKCPLQCAHCSEWDTLNQKDILSREEYEQKIRAMVNYGVSQIVYSGGEPLNRFADLVYLIERFDHTSQWIYTSGYGLTPEKATHLKLAGLEGVAVSLDHHIPEEHNAFRGNNRSFFWVENAVRNCLDAGLFVSINICPSREYITAGGIDDFMKLMRAWQIPTVNILEPRAVGHFAGQDVELREEEKKILDECFYRYNFSPAFDDYPVLTYPGISRKYVKCGGGISYLLLDYDGTLRPCPFCKTPMSSPVNREILCEA
ncbi:MAG: radical SAM protein [Bacteroidia bacterium]|nr:radical SAM protein [Bacteroidia bacterium]